LNSFHLSVSSLFLSLKDSLLGAGASVVREQSVVDATFELDSAFVRLRMKDFGLVKAIQLSVGPNEERLSMEDRDPRYCFPFLVDAPADEVSLNTHWSSESRILGLVISGGDSKKYKGTIDTYSKSFVLVHFDPVNPHVEGDFFSAGIQFMRCGA